MLSLSNTPQLTFCRAYRKLNDSYNELRSVHKRLESELRQVQLASDLPVDKEFRRETVEQDEFNSTPNRGMSGESAAQMTISNSFLRGTSIPGSIQMNVKQDETGNSTSYVLDSSSFNLEPMPSRRRIGTDNTDRATRRSAREGTRRRNKWERHHAYE